MSDDDRDIAFRPLPDEADAVDLEGSYAAAVCIMVNGVAWPWLLDLDHEGPDGSGCAGCCCAPHEQVGALPTDVLERITPRPRCGHPRRSDGQPCRAEVPAEGAGCRWHRTPAGEQGGLW